MGGLSFSPSMNTNTENIIYINKFFTFLYRAWFESVWLGFKIDHLQNLMACFKIDFKLILVHFKTSFSLPLSASLTLFTLGFII